MELMESLDLFIEPMNASVGIYWNMLQVFELLKECSLQYIEKGI